jgi:hypothetical protein
MYGLEAVKPARGRGGAVAGMRARSIRQQDTRNSEKPPRHHVLRAELPARAPERELYLSAAQPRLGPCVE